MKGFARLILLLIVLLVPSALLADTIVINFDNLNDSDSVTNQYSGVTFSNATVLTAGVSLNELENPPHSGSNVAFDDGGPMSLSFASLITSFSGYFTYGEPAPEDFTNLIVDAYDSNNNLVATTVSAFSNNQAISGDFGSTPNEFLQLSYAAGISEIIITADPFGGSFTADDLTYSTANSAVPEPSSISLLFIGMTGLLVFRKKRV